MSGAGRGASGPRLTAASPAGEAAIAVLAREVERMRAHEGAAPGGEDAEALHEMRVATRRIRSAMRLFEPVLVLPRRARRGRVGEVADALGPVRDRDVWLTLLERRGLPRLPAAERRRAEPLLAELRAERRAALDALRDFLAGGRYDKTRRALRDYLEAPVLTTAAEAPLAAYLPDRLVAIATAVFVHAAWGPEADGPALHDLRLAVKRARYATSFFADCYGETVAAWLRWLSLVQEDLGAVHDCDALLSRAAARSPALAANLRADREEAVRRVRLAAAAWADPDAQADLLDRLARPHAPGANGAVGPPSDVLRRAS